MNDDAEFYKAHKDDESQWGEPEVAGPGRVVKPRKFDSIVSTRFDPETIALLREKAGRIGITQSELIRRLVWDAVRPPRTWSCKHITVGKAAWARCGHGCEMTAA